MQPVSARARWLALIAATSGWMLDGFELGLYPLVSRPALKELLGAGFNDATFTWWNSIIIATFLIGAALGGWIFGWVGDRIGRVKAMLITVLLFSVFSFLCAFAQEAWHIAALRFVAALGMGGEWALGVALVMEAWPSSTRPMMAGLIGAAGNIGFLMCALIGYSLASFSSTIGGWLAPFVPAEWVDPAHGYWRVMFVIGLLPAIVGLVIRMFVPESEAWKHSQASAGSAPKPGLTRIFVPEWRGRVLIGTALAAMALIGTWACVQNIPAWAHKLAENTEGAGTARSLTLIASACGATCGAFLAPLLAHWIGRQRSYAFLSAASLMVSWILFQKDVVYGGTFLAMTFAIAACTASFYGWLPLYLPELFPTRIRATAQGFAYNAGRMITAMVILITGGSLLPWFGGDFAAMFKTLCFVYVIGLIIIWFAPETKGQPLPE